MAGTALALSEQVMAHRPSPDMEFSDTKASFLALNGCEPPGRLWRHPQVDCTAALQCPNCLS